VGYETVAVNKQATNNEDLLQLAIKAAKDGQKDGAKVMFRQVYSRDKRNETAMMWLAKLAKSQKERVLWLNRVLAVNSDNEAAKQALERINYKRAASNNRTILLFGAVAFVMIVITIAIIVVVIS
jgi:hypothetical protein